MKLGHDSIINHSVTIIIIDTSLHTKKEDKEWTKTIKTDFLKPTNA